MVRPTVARVDLAALKSNYRAIDERLHRERPENPPRILAVVKANAFLETLDAKQREKALLDFDSAKKPSWSNLPVTFVPRNGLALGELTKPQRAAAE